MAADPQRRLPGGRTRQLPHVLLTPGVATAGRSLPDPGRAAMAAGPGRPLGGILFAQPEPARQSAGSRYAQESPAPPPARQHAFPAGLGARHPPIFGTSWVVDAFR